MRAIPHDLLLQPVSRRPTTLAPATVAVASSLGPSLNVGARVSSSTNIDTSIILVTFNSSLFTKLCVVSILSNSVDECYELIVVDNASTDDTIEFLTSVSQGSNRVRLIRNSTNRGFAAANNQGLAAAAGRNLILLNNDTIVAPGWLDLFTSHLTDPAVGMVGATTNRAANQAQIETHYQTYGEFLGLSERRAREFKGQCFEIPMLIMFAVAMRQEVYRRIGLLDEKFGLGMFEDDDYAMRMREAGLKLICAKDLLIHHFGQGSFGQIGSEYDRLLQKNRSYFEAKWKVKWRPHERIHGTDYEQLCHAIVRAVDSNLPANGSIALILSNGDQSLVDQVSRNGRKAGHFPSDASGMPLSHHPADGREALRLLQDAIGSGGRYLLIPKPYFWWLDYYQEMNAKLTLCHRIDAEDGCCAIFDLSTLAVEQQHS